ncbi:hypothetical protein OBBRIDRAFT_35892 [Obba rivulosa]|uniref:Uncharacterized protein n=1 Tax=Obba rivulosa TaxID=1052685 RepID=A0A8E2ARS5_9APHY|nr:hypothetical protein OBBRIDRAFT_35892 [Obba rivulosa]
MQRSFSTGFAGLAEWTRRQASATHCGFASAVLVTRRTLYRAQKNPVVIIRLCGETSLYFHCYRLTCLKRHWAAQYLTHKLATRGCLISTSRISGRSPKSSRSCPSLHTRTCRFRDSSRFGGSQRKRDHCRAVRKWEYSLKVQEQERENEIRDSRRAEMEAKLKELGYSEHDFPHTKEWRIIVDKPRYLTPRIWSQAKPKLIRLIENAKEDVIRTELETRVKVRCGEIHEHYGHLLETWACLETKELLPNLIDLSALPSFQDLSRRGQALEPVSQGEFLQVFHGEVVQSQIEEYKDRVKRDLAHMLSHIERKSRTTCTHVGMVDGSNVVNNDDNDDVDAVLARPTALFSCVTHSGKTLEVHQSALSFPAIHSHWRDAHPYSPWGCDPSTGEVWPPSVSGNRRKKGWPIMVPAYIKHASITAKLVSRILKMLRLDGPEYAEITVSELDALVKAGRIVCLCGHPHLPAPRDWSWGGLITHVMSEQRSYQEMMQYQMPGYSGRTPPHNDHNLADRLPFVCFLTAEEANRPRSERPAKKPVISEILRLLHVHMLCGYPRCLSCDTGRSYEYRSRDLPPLASDPALIAYHMETKHRKIFQPSDLIFY